MLDEILRTQVAKKASDVVLKAGSPPAYRVNADLVPDRSQPPLDVVQLDSILDTLLDDYKRKRFTTDLQADLAYEVDGERFRVNVFRQRGEPALVIRHVQAKVRSIQDLYLPTVVEKLAEERRGLVLVTGATGSGKSTTLAAMISHINQTRAANIITIEDPIEYLHRDAKSLVSQREIGYDAVSFASALRAALRQNPDVILVGEMRDLETMETAILAAETGHLVVSTMHTLDAQQTVTRAIGVFPEQQRDQIRLILASVLRGVISQRLVPRADGKGMVPSVEVLIATERVREYIADKAKTREIKEVLAQGHSSYGSQTFDQSLLNLYQSNLISYEEALMQATNPSDFALKVGGISSTSDSRWKDFEAGANSSSGIEIERF
jgi:twitching motility protein PilT